MYLQQPTQSGNEDRQVIYLHKNTVGIVNKIENMLSIQSDWFMLVFLYIYKLIYNF